MSHPFANDLADYAPIAPLPQRLQAHPDFSGRGVTMAFLDSGFFPHPDFARRVVTYADATGEVIIERRGYRSAHATSWHGTMTAGAAAGSGTLSKGLYRGLAAGARLVLVKTGQPGTFRINERDIARALSWVLLHHTRLEVRVINISLGGDVPTRGRLTALDRLVEEAAALGLVVVCAAGNSGQQRIVPPASAPSAISVGGFNDGNGARRAAWTMYHSSYGSGVGGALKPELIAPAQWVPAPMLPESEAHARAQLLWQLENAGERTLNKLLATPQATAVLGVDVAKPHAIVRRAVRQLLNEGKFIHPHYQHVDGTSFAAPIVSSIVAQMLEANPALGPAAVKEILMQTAEPLEDVPVERQGAGVVSAGAAVRAAQRSRERLDRHMQAGV